MVLVTKKEEKRQLHYKSRQAEKHIYEQSRIPGKIETIEEKVNREIIKEKDGIAIVSGVDRSRAIATKHTFDDSALKRRREVYNRIECQETPIGTGNELLENAEHAVPRNSELELQIDGNQFENSRSFGRQEESGKENLFEFETNRGKTGKLTKSTLSASLTRSRANETEEFGQPLADEAIAPISQSAKTSKPTSEITADNKFDETDFDKLLRADNDEKPSKLTNELQSESKSEENTDGLLRNESLRRNISEVAASDETIHHFIRDVAEDFDSNVQHSHNIALNFSKT